MTSRTTPMSPVDAAWYHIDGPANLAQVTGILFTKTPLDFERVKAVYEHRLPRFERFRQRVVESGFPIATPHWQEVSPFDIDQHLHHIALPAPRDRAALTALVGDMASMPLAREQPLWQVHVIDEVNGGSALVMRFHHCMGDGTAMMALSQELFDTSADAPLGALEPAAPHPEAGLFDRLVGSAAQAVGWSARALASTVQTGVEAVTHPQQVLERAGVAAEGVGMLLTEVLRPPDPKSPLKGEFGLKKRVAWSDPVAIADVKAIGALADAKVNDVLVAGVTGALRAYLRSRGVDARRLTLRAMVPVDLRPRERALELGNHFGLVILELAVGSRTGLDRLRRTKANMDALKRSPEAVAIMTLFNVFGRGPKLVEDLAVDLFSSKASVVLTNVAGPRERLYLAGTPIERMLFWVPHPGRQLGMGISVLSYAGYATLAVIADARLVPDPEAITRQFSREFARMLSTARRRHASRSG